jgi:hypothetical protein
MIVLETNEIAACVTRRDGRIYLVSHVKRVGGTAFIAAIEWFWYAPDTPRNRLFDVYGAEWHSMHWIITAFPSGRLPAVRHLAKQLGLRIANGPPVMLGERGSLVFIQASSRPSDLTDLVTQDVPMEFFPGTMLPNGQENDTIFTIENDRGSPIYKNRQRDEDTMFAASGEISEALNHGVKLTPRQMADYIYGSGSFPYDQGSVSANRIGR